MNSKIVSVVVLQFMLACVPLNRPAAALEHYQDPEQLWEIGWELSQECLNHRDPLRVTGNRQIRLNDRGRIHTRVQQIDLSQELLSSTDNSANSKEQESGLLEELAETLIP